MFAVHHLVPVSRAFANSSRRRNCRGKCGVIVGSDWERVEKTFGDGGSHGHSANQPFALASTIAGCISIDSRDSIWRKPPINKKTRYHIKDPMLRFRFRTYSPHRTRWHRYKAEKSKLLHDHASTVFEDFCRQRYPDASCYWENNLEFDFVRSEPGDHGHERAVVSEIKWKELTRRERIKLENQLATGWQRCGLRNRFKEVTFEVLDATILKSV